MKYYCFYKGELLLRKDADKYSIPEEMPLTLDNVQDIDFCGTVSKAANMDKPYEEDEKYVMMPLRQTFFHLGEEEFKTATKCAEILYWDETTKYCSVCGAPMERHTNISKICTKCGREVWPQLAIAIIVRITRGDKILLVKARTFRKDFYGLVAGFVETGEGLEQAVEREIKEEVGLRIRKLKYFGSQSWPFPCGLMVGFTAEYESGEITLQEEELIDGKWFGKDNLPNIPDKMSIARRLIDDWINQQP